MPVTKTPMPHRGDEPSGQCLYHEKLAARARDNKTSLEKVETTLDDHTVRLTKIDTKLESFAKPIKWFLLALAVMGGSSVNDILELAKKMGWM